MKHLATLAAPLAVLGLALGTASCNTSANANNHWHVDNVGTRMSYHFTGDLLANDRIFKEEAQRDVGDVGLTLSRHLMNDDPYNPLLPSNARPVPPPTAPEGEFEVGP
jgi:hypothetical protein